MRIRDDTGAAWPLTGHRCTRCRLPLDPVHADAGTHPLCDAGAPLSDPVHDRVLATLTRALAARALAARALAAHPERKAAA